MPHREITDPTIHLADGVWSANEPTAAALAYGFEEKLFDNASDGGKILIYDLGGGTFDVSLLEFRQNRFVTLATDGNVQLGGRDFDAAIKDHVAEKFGGSGAHIPPWF